MSDVKRLLDEATPLPWQGCAHVTGTDSECPCRYRGDVWGEEEKVLLQLGVGPDHPDGHDEGSGWKSIPTTTLEQGYANGRLIVYAVNRLPDYEAAVDWLDHLVTILELAAEDGLLSFDTTEPRAALARLRESVPA